MGKLVAAMEEKSAGLTKSAPVGQDPHLPRHPPLLPLLPLTRLNSAHPAHRAPLGNVVPLTLALIMDLQMAVDVTPPK